MTVESNSFMADLESVGVPLKLVTASTSSTWFSDFMSRAEKKSELILLQFTFMTCIMLIFSFKN